MSNLNVKDMIIKKSFDWQQQQKRIHLIRLQMQLSTGERMEHKDPCTLDENTKETISLGKGFWTSLQGKQVVVGSLRFMKELKLNSITLFKD